MNVVLVGMSEWQRRVHWKLVVALPVVSQQSVQLSDWIRRKLSIGSVPSKQADSQVNTTAVSLHLCTSLFILFSLANVSHINVGSC